MTYLKEKRLGIDATEIAHLETSAVTSHYHIVFAFTWTGPLYSSGLRMRSAHLYHALPACSHGGSAAVDLPYRRFFLLQTLAYRFLAVSHRGV